MMAPHWVCVWSTSHRGRLFYPRAALQACPGCGGSLSYLLPHGHTWSNARLRHLQIILSSGSLLYTLLLMMPPLCHIRTRYVSPSWKLTNKALLTNIIIVLFL